MKRVRVLIFPAGSEIGLEIYRSLCHNLHVELFGVSGKADHARFVYDQDHYREGDDFYIDRPEFLVRFNLILKEFAIDFVFPTHDSVVLFLAENQNSLRAKVITSDVEVTRIARKKREIYRHFQRFEFGLTTYNPPFQEAIFPIFLKPNEGQGGKGTFIVNSVNELLRLMLDNPSLVACEYLPGDELSVDCFTDRKGNLLFVGPRKRHRIEMGISFNTFSVPLTEEIKGIAETVNSEMRFRGPWFFQVKQDNAGKYRLLEFAPRIASTMGLYRQCGINFPLLSLFDAMGIDVEVLNNNIDIELDRCLSNRYRMQLEYQNVYIDFDDTIIVNGQVNEQAIVFLYQCKRLKKRVTLLTKHKFNILETLDRFFISSALFDSIIQVKEFEPKGLSINPENAIFIDNHFLERQQVRKHLGIPVFDVDAIECLIKF